MSYEQHMKHWGNHHKDRFVQQCSGYAGNDIPNSKNCLTKEQEHLMLVHTFENIVSIVKECDFPIYIAIEKDAFCSLVSSNNWFGTKIENFEQLQNFGQDYIYQ